MYANIIVRIGRYKLDDIVKTIVPSLLENRSKTPELYIVGLRAARFLLGVHGNTEAYSQSDMDAVKSYSQYATSITAFVQENTPKVAALIKNVCEPVVGLAQVLKSPVHYHVSSFKHVQNIIILLFRLKPLS